MIQEILDKSDKARLRSMTAKVAASARKATNKALKKRAQIDAEMLRRRDQQSARERKLDDILSEVIQGLSAIIEFGRNKEIRKLVAARTSIQYETALFTIGGADAYVSVFLHPSSVELYIQATVLSCVQSVGSLPSFSTCKISRSFPIEDGEKLTPGWFWRLFHADLHHQWYRCDYQSDGPVSKDERSANRVSDHDLACFERLKIEELDPYDLRDEELNLVLLRILADCGKPHILRQHVNTMLAGF